jgi:pimeloyl-ACP methyl ester carboxylesterase
MNRLSVTIDGARLEVFVYGSGPPCLLLHGYPQNHECWRKVIPQIQHLRTLYAPDWFGWGESERSLTLSLRYEDEFPRIGKLLDALDLDRTDLAAHDYGGLLGLAYATRHPERITRLALINTRAHGSIGFGTRILLNAMVACAQLRTTRSLIPHLPLKSIHELMFSQYVKNGSFSKDELEGYLQFLNTREGRLWFAHFYHHFRTTARSELGELARSLSCPTALIWGDADPYFPVQIGEDLARIIPGAVLHRIAGAGHFSLEERPAEVASALVELFQKATPAD